MLLTGDCFAGCGAHDGQAQSEREVDSLAFLREKWLSEEQYDRQEAQPEQYLTGDMQPPDLEWFFQFSRRRTNDVQRGREQKSSEQIQEYFQAERKLWCLQRALQSEVKERFQESGTQVLGPR